MRGVRFSMQLRERIHWRHSMQMNMDFHLQLQMEL